MHSSVQNRNMAKTCFWIIKEFVFQCWSSLSKQPRWNVAVIHELCCYNVVLRPGTGFHCCFGCSKTNNQNTGSNPAQRFSNWFTDVCLCERQPKISPHIKISRWLNLKYIQLRSWLIYLKDFLPICCHDSISTLWASLHVACFTINFNWNLQNSRIIS